MGGFFGVASKQDCVLELFYGVDYHSHLGTRRGGMATFGEDGFYRSIPVSYTHLAFYNWFTLKSQEIYNKATFLRPEVKVMIPFVCAGILGFTAPDLLGSGHALIEYLTTVSYTHLGKIPDRKSNGLYKRTDR